MAAYAPGGDAPGRMLAGLRSPGMGGEGELPCPTSPSPRHPSRLFLLHEASGWTLGGPHEDLPNNLNPREMPAPGAVSLAVSPHRERRSMPRPSTAGPKSSPGGAGGVRWGRESTRLACHVQNGPG